MTPKTFEKELLELERRYWQAIQQKDTATIVRLTDDSCIVAGAQGVARLDRDTVAKMMQGGSWILDQFQLGDEQVRMLGDDVAVIAYKVHEELTVDGAPVSLDAADSSTWVRRGGQWVCASHTEAISGDPFGRDRRPVH